MSAPWEYGITNDVVIAELQLLITKLQSGAATAQSLTASARASVGAFATQEFTVVYAEQVPTA